MNRSKTPPFSAALIGCGRVSRYHIDALKRLSDTFRTVAVCDIDREAGERAAALLDTNYTPHFQDLLTDAPDLIVIATPSGAHAQQSLAALRAGSHVLTEKPMATRWNDVVEMNQVALETGRHLFVVKQQRHLPSVRSVRKAIKEGALGRLYSVGVNVIWRRPQSYYDLADWRGTYADDGGALMNQAIHYVDLLQWIVGPVESVQSFAATLARRIEVEDTLTACLKFRSGALGTISVTTLAHPDNFGCDLTLVGERGTIRLGGMACEQILHWGVEGEAPPSAASDAYVYESGHQAVYRQVAQYLTDGTGGAVDGIEGAKSLEIVIAAYRAASEGSKVTLPL